MTMTSDTYYAVRCNAQVDNLLHPRCLTVSAGGFNDQTAVLEAALKVGWTENAGRHMCPQHSRQGIMLPKPERKSRAPKVAAVAVAENYTNPDVYLGAPTS